MRSGLIVPATLAAACVALPAPLTSMISVGPIAFYVYEPLLLLCAVWALGQSRQHRILPYVVPFAVVSGLVVLAAFLDDGNPTKIISDTRQFVIVVLALFVASRVVGTPIADSCARVLKWVLWFSAVMILLASTTGLTLAGRSEVATLNYGSAVGATRLLTPATYPAVAVIIICLAYLIGGKVRFKQVLPWLAPAILIAVLAFSRNHVLGFVVGVLFALVAFRSSRSVAAALRITVVFAAVLFALSFGLSNVLYGLPGASFVASQIDSYTSRVIDGFQPGAIERDTSVLFREEENYFMEQAIDEAPAFGNGYGFQYKPATGPVGSFTREIAPYYAHNFYLWIMVKSGLVGLLAFLWMTAVPLLRTIVTRSSETSVALGAAVAGMLAISFVAPMPNGSPTGLLFGAALGGVIALLPRRERDAGKPDVRVKYASLQGRVAAHP